MRQSAVALAIASAIVAVKGDKTTYDQNAGCNKDQLLRWFHSDTGLFYNNDNNPYWWQGGNMLTTLSRFGKLDSSIKDQVSSTIASIYANAPSNKPFALVKKDGSQSHHKHYVARNSPAARKMKRQGDVGFENSFYDDEAWWGLGFVDAWILTGNIDYLNEAIYIWDDMKSAWGAPSCGGIYWNKNANSPVNAIENGLFIHLSAAIANNVGDDVKQTYVQAAKDAWTWFQGTGMINSDNLINDGINDSCQNNGNPTYTYNQGVVISGLAQLSKATGDSSYLDAAGNIANAVITKLVDSNGILGDDCDRSQTCGAGDGEQFKGVFTRGLSDLYAQRQNDDWKNFLTNNAQSIWDKDFNGDNGACNNGVYWGGPYNTADASTQSSALDTLIAALAVTQ